jgi:hypothetical protein
MDMLQLWTRASLPRFVLVVAVFSVITLAASNPIYSAARGRHVPAASRTATADCSVRAADELVKRLGLSDPSVTNPVYKVLCGAFAGPGSQTMVVSLLGPGSTGMIDWVVFRSLGGEWQFLMKRHQAAVLTAAGSDIREKVWIFRSGDPRCCPSGGTKARIWHWDGTRFVASAWKQVTSGKAPKKDAVVFSPLRYGVTCHMTDDGSFRGSWVYCWIGGKPHPTRHVKLNLDGRFSVAATTAIPLGLGGPVTPYGTRVTVGRFRCLSLRSGMRCTVIRSGKGFLINRDGVRRVGP